MRQDALPWNAFYVQETWIKTAENALVEGAWAGNAFVSNPCAGNTLVPNPCAGSGRESNMGENETKITTFKPKRGLWSDSEKLKVVKYMTSKEVWSSYGVERVRHFQHVRFIVSRVRSFFFFFFFFLHVEKLSENILEDKRTSYQVQYWWKRTWSMYTSSLKAGRNNKKFSDRSLAKFKQSEIYALIRAA
jgi:hypothetical protein